MVGIGNLKQLPQSALLLTVLTFTPVGALNVLEKKNVYTGVSATFANYQLPPFLGEAPQPEATLTALYGRQGVKLHRNVSIEARAGLGAVGDNENYYSLGPLICLVDNPSDCERLPERTLTEVNLNSLLGGYIRAGASVNKSWLYLIAGYSQAEIEFSARGRTNTRTISSVSLGLGADVQLLLVLKGNIEWMNYLDHAGEQVSGLNFGLVWSF